MYHAKTFVLKIILPQSMQGEHQINFLESIKSRSV